MKGSLGNPVLHSIPPVMAGFNHHLRLSGPKGMPNAVRQFTTSLTAIVLPRRMPLPLFDEPYPLRDDPVPNIS